MQETSIDTSFLQDHSDNEEIIQNAEEQHRATTSLPSSRSLVSRTRSIDEEEERVTPNEPWKNTKPPLFQLSSSKKRAKKLLRRIATRSGTTTSSREGTWTKRKWRKFIDRRRRNNYTRFGDSIHSNGIGIDIDDSLRQEKENEGDNDYEEENDHSPLLVKNCFSDSLIADYSLLNRSNNRGSDGALDTENTDISLLLRKQKENYQRHQESIPQPQRAFTFDQGDLDNRYNSSSDSLSFVFDDDQDDDDDDISYGESVDSSAHVPSHGDHSSQNRMGEEDFPFNNKNSNSPDDNHINSRSLQYPRTKISISSDEQNDSSHAVQTNFNLSPRDLPTEPSTTTITMRTALMKCVRAITHNPVSKCILRLPTLADSLPSTLQILLDHPKSVFGAMVAACGILDVVIILPGYLLAYLITEFGVYASVLLAIWSFGRLVLRTITFPGSTARATKEIEKEFAKYSFRMLENATQAVEALVTNLIQSDEDVTFYNRDIASDKSIRVLGMNSASEKYEVIPMWKKVTQYRDRVFGVYHDVLKCLLVKDSDLSLSSDHVNLDELNLTKYGNNFLVGDIGNLSGVSTKAKSDGDALLKALTSVLEDLDRLERSSKDYLESSLNDIDHKVLSSEGRRAAQRLLVSSHDLADCLDSINPSILPVDHNNDSDDESEHGNLYNPRRKTAFQTAYGNVKTILGGLIEMLDPPPLDVIFGLDVLRGTVLSRYQGAQQFWIPRGKSEGGGSIDAMHIPHNKKRKNLSVKEKMDKTVLFCNPNAGLFEVATGLSLIGGNVTTSSLQDIVCWSDFYLENGYDVIIFNYAGYGRSHVGKRNIDGDFAGGIHVVRRIISSFLFSFTPSPSSLKSDATAVAGHIIEKMGVDKFVIHGESIGGMAASGAANVISHRKYVDANSLPITYPTLLICDRTFCNLNATAYRLVGTWTSIAIPLLTPFWNSDVAGDYSSARCRKVVAQDAADAIIHDCASLKKGVATAKELLKEKTNGIGTLGDIPLTYRMADYEEVGVKDSKIARFPAKHIPAPTWPADKHLDLSVNFHFAACVRRIGKLATAIRKNQIFTSMKQSPTVDEEEGIEITAVFSRDEEAPPEETIHSIDPVIQIWETLGRCDGLCGFPLGAAVKDSHDCTIDWLSCMVTLGSQKVALVAESRFFSMTQTKLRGSFDGIVVEDEDFSVSEAMKMHNGDESEIELQPMPLPEVIKVLQVIIDTVNATSDEEYSGKKVQHELSFILDVLKYVKERIKSKQTATNALQVAHFKDTFDGFSTGRFLNLNCGHNNQFSFRERAELRSVLNEAIENENFLT